MSSGRGENDAYISESLFKFLFGTIQDPCELVESRNAFKEMLDEAPPWRDSVKKWNNLFPLFERIEMNCGHFTDIIAETIIDHVGSLNFERALFVVSEKVRDIFRSRMKLLKSIIDVEKRLKTLLADKEVAEVTSEFDPEYPFCDWDESFLKLCEEQLRYSEKNDSSYEQMCKRELKGSRLDGAAYYLCELLAIAGVKGQESHDFAQTILSTIASEDFEATSSSLHISVRSGRIRRRVASFRKRFKSK